MGVSERAHHLAIPTLTESGTAASDARDAEVPESRFRSVRAPGQLDSACHV